MAQLDIGYLYKKRKIIFKENEYEIFELLDYVIGTSFTNPYHINRFNIATGKYTNKYASQLKENGNDEDLIFISCDLQDTIKENDNNVDFEEIKNKKFSQNPKYYIRDDNGTNLIALVNEELIDYIKNVVDKENINEKQSNEETVDMDTIYSTIKNSIFGQDEQIQSIITSLFKNQKMIEMGLDKNSLSKLKENILIAGPKGTGKTEIVKIFANLMNIPLIIENRETLETKEDISRMLNKLYALSNENMDLFKKGIIIFEHMHSSPLQGKLNQLLKGYNFYYTDTVFDISTLTFIFEQELENPEKINHFYFSNIADKKIMMNSLSLNDYIQILNESELSPLKLYEKFFQSLNIDFEFDESFINYVAHIAKEEMYEGAKELKYVLNDIISKVLVNIISGEYSGVKLINPNENNGKNFILKRNESNNKYSFTLKKQI